MLTIIVFVVETWAQINGHQATVAVSLFYMIWAILLDLWFMAQVHEIIRVLTQAVKAFVVKGMNVQALNDMAKFVKEHPVK